MGTASAWRGVLVATALPFRQDLSIDYDAYAEHTSWLFGQGCDGVTPNGSLGEYQALSAEERAQVLRVALDAAPENGTVIPGVSGYGFTEACRWTENAAQAGCPAVMLLPPNGYRADDRTVLEHYREVAAIGLPVIAYNNPVDTKVDLTPELLARLYGEGLIVAVKDFSGDVRRMYRLAELAPSLDVLAGADDVALEFFLAGAVGWISGYANVFPQTCCELFRAGIAGDAIAGQRVYRGIHSLLRLSLIHISEPTRQAE